MRDNPPLATADGLALASSSWQATGTPQGHVLIVHGLGEHRLRYRGLAMALSQAGWDVTAYDQRGHGNSPGRRGDLPHADALLDDLGRVIDRVREGRQGRNAPLVLLGHSLGGVVAARMVAEAPPAALESTTAPRPARPAGTGAASGPAPWWRPVEALVLSSPALDPGLRPFQALLLAVARRAFPHLTVNNGLQPAWISRDAAVVQDYASDPLVHDRVSAALTVFLLEAAATVQVRAPQWPLPTLLLWAGADRCVRPEGSTRFLAAAAAAGTVRGLAYPGLFHEIFNEPERAQVMAGLVDWLTGLFPR